jgi:SAM-dependent methyltransferase
MSGLNVSARPRPSAIGADGDAVAFFHCMRCGQDLTQDPSGDMACAACGTIVAVQDGIVDFVGGSAKTQLDNIDYDKVYGINEEHSLSLYHVLRRATGPLWPKDFGDAIEIGCGTGGLSLALLSNISAHHVVLTDISVKMLRLCRERLRLAPFPSDIATAFATYSGSEDCFHPDAFDTCFGTAVVHHITDVVGFLGRVHTLLKQGGCAFFMEPNLAFHRALTSTLTDIVADILDGQPIPDEDVGRMLSWAGEVHCNIANSGDLEVLAEREDKHLFVAETFEGWAEAAGFAQATALPCDRDPTGWGTIQDYFGQIGISAETMTVLREKWPTSQARHFGLLAPRDRSPSYLFWLRKGPRKPIYGTPVVQRPPVEIAPALAPQPPTKIWLRLGLHRGEQGLEISVTGWCLAGEPVRSVQVTTCGFVRRIPIWRPRPDVQTAMNRDRAYNPLYALCSGVEGTLALGNPEIDDDRIQAVVHVVAADGTLLPVRTVSLTVDGEDVEISGE